MQSSPDWQRRLVASGRTDRGIDWITQTGKRGKYENKADISGNSFERRAFRNCLRMEGMQTYYRGTTLLSPSFLQVKFDEKSRISQNEDANEGSGGARRIPSISFRTARNRRIEAFSSI